MEIIDKIGLNYNTTNETVNEEGDALDRAMKMIKDQSALLIQCATKILDQRIRIDDLVKENKNLKEQMNLLKRLGD